MASPLDQFRLGTHRGSERLMLLQACVAVEEHCRCATRARTSTRWPTSWRAWISSSTSLLQMVGTLVNQSPSRRMRLPCASASMRSGASWQAARRAAAGRARRGMLHIRLRGALVQTLDLYAEITDSEAWVPG